MLIPADADWETLTARIDPERLRSRYARMLFEQGPGEDREIRVRLPAVRRPNDTTH